MPTAVADRSSNKNEQLVNAAETIGRSDHRRRVFRAIYTGKSKAKTVVDVMNATGLPRTRALDAGKALADGELVTSTKVKGVTAYEKIEFFQRHRDRVLRLAANKKSRETLPTKRNPRQTDRLKVAVELRAGKSRIPAKHITIDDIDSFGAAKKIAMSQPYVKIPESLFKAGVAGILGERGSFKDWGGELRDLSSTRLKIKGARRIAAIAFKGPGKTGKLTPNKMGKNGDQIQRLVKCPAEVFLVQYWGEIDDSVLEQLENFVRLKAYFEGRQLWYGIVDGQDSSRVMKAYSHHFPKRFIP
jgi:hypothetical protein